MKFSKSPVVAYLFIATAVNAEEHKNFGWGKLAVRLPEPLSDHTATLDPATNLVYIAGGCGGCTQF
jgi:hypothetical protein